jgi:hypothetical protein
VFSRVPVEVLTEGGVAARVVLWPHVYHYLFIAKPDDVLEEMRAFIGSLPK